MWNKSLLSNKNWRITQANFCKSKFVRNANVLIDLRINVLAVSRKGWGIRVDVRAMANVETILTDGFSLWILLLFDLSHWRFMCMKSHVCAMKWLLETYWCKTRKNRQVVVSFKTCFKDCQIDFTLQNINWFQLCGTLSGKLCDICMKLVGYQILESRSECNFFVAEINLFQRMALMFRNQKLKYGEIF